MVAFCSPPKKVRPARLYLLKKIHKNPMGIHPIVFSCDSATENISQFIDYWLQPIMKRLPSYLKDTLKLINELKEISVEPDTILVTVDVKSLYTCIPHDEGIAACKEALNSTLESNLERPDISILICLLEIVLKNNTFEFDNKFYKQLQETAMGTKLPQLMPISSWANWSMKFFPKPPLNHYFTKGTLTIYSSYGHTPNSSLMIFYFP